MSLFDALRHRLHVLRRGEDYADEQAHEVAFHLELATREHSGGDGNRPDAEQAARREFGNVTRYREDAREMSLLAWLDRLRQDLGYAWRGFRREPAFMSGVVVTLGLGVGLNGAVLSLLDRLFVRPPAGLESPQQLRRLYVEAGGHSSGSRAQPGHRPPDSTQSEKWVHETFPFRVYADIESVFGQTMVGAYSSSDSVGIDTPTAYVAKRTFVSANFFSVLGVRLWLGRTFTAEEARPDRSTSVVVISEDLRRHLFGREVSGVGQTVRISGEAFTVIGVASGGFTGLDLDRVDVWAPLGGISGRLRDDKWYTTSSEAPLKVFTRVPKGIVPQPLEVALATRLHTDIANGIDLGEPMMTSHGHLDSAMIVSNGPIVEAAGPMRRDVETSVALRVGAVALIVFLISCANVTNLLLLRGVRHSREIAVRRALGVSRARLGMQVFLESLLLAALGCLAAVMVAFGGTALLRGLLFPSIGWSGGVVDLRTLWSVAGIAVVAGIVAGITPALTAANPDVMVLLRRSSQHVSRGASARSALVILQTALCVTLLVGAMLFIRSLLNAKGIRLGYDIREVMFADVPIKRYDEADAITKRAADFQQIANDMQSFPGIGSIAMASVPPLTGVVSTVKAYRPDADSALPFVFGTAVTRNYFETVGIRVLGGRDFVDHDFARASPVMVVSRQMASTVWPGESPIGRCLIVGSKTSPCVKVVGLVEDSHIRLLEKAPVPLFYLPFGVMTGLPNTANDWTGVGPDPSIIVRAQPASLGRIAAELSRRLASVAPRNRPFRVRTLQQQLAPELRPWLVGAQLFTALGVLALLVAAVGMYSVSSYAMSQRSHEIGVRLAFGAGAGDILRLAALRGFEILLAGIALGVLMAVVLSRFVASLLFGVEPTDVPVLVGAALALLAVGTLSGFLPAWRGSRIDPVTTLAAE